MPVTSGQRTFGQVLVTTAKKLGLVLAQGTATAGTGTTLTDANLMQTLTANARSVVGKFLYIFGGTSAGTAKEVTSYATNVFTWVGSVTVPDTTSTWVLLDARIQDLIDAVTEAQRILALSHPLQYRSTGLVSQNLLDSFGAFEEWPNGTSTSPEGWGIVVGAPTITRDATIRQGRYSLNIAAGGALATMLCAIPESNWTDYSWLQGQSLTLKGFMSESGAGDGTVRVIVTAKDGTITNTDFTGTLTGSRWERLEDISSADIVLPANLYSVGLQLRVAANKTVLFDNLKLFGGPSLRRQTLPYSLTDLEPVIWMDSEENRNDFSIALRYKEDWRLWREPDTARRGIQWFRDLPQGRNLLVHGLQAAAVVTDTITNLNFDADLIATTAAALLAPENARLQAAATNMQRRLSTRANRALVSLEYVTA